MKIGIVGSRKRLDKENVYAFVDSLNQDDIIVSGGCRGVDTWAEERALHRGLEVNIFYPDLSGIHNYFESVKAYHSRNRKIVENSDVIFAFVSQDRKGGTENTIKYAKELGIKVVIK